MFKIISLIRILWWCCGLCSNLTIAAEIFPRLEDFAYGANLNLTPNGAIYILTLTEKIYAGVTKGDLGDIRVFNGLKESVPYIIRRPPTIKLQQPSSFKLPLTILPHDPNFQNINSQKIKLYTTVNETNIEVVPNYTPETTAYLLDIRSLARDGKWNHLSELNLHWETPPATGFVIPIRIEASADFNHWQFAGEGTLVDLPVANQRLIKNTLKINYWNAYLRLTWKTQDQNVLLKEAEIIPNSLASEIIPPERQWHKAALIHSDAKANVYEFDSHGKMPIDRINIHLPQPNTIVMAKIKTRNSLTDLWVTNFTGIIYDLMVNNVALRNDEIILASENRSQFWQLSAASGEKHFGAGLPNLELGWIAHQLLFLARGVGPYQLAWGSNRWGQYLTAETAFIQQLADHPENLKIATLSEPFQLSGTIALKPPAFTLPWARLALWAILILGVVALAIMSRYVYQQLQ